MGIFEGIQKSIAGWQMGLGYVGAKIGETLGFGGLKADSGIPGVSKTQIGETLIGPGYGAARMRFAAIKAGKVVEAESGERLVGVRYIRSAEPVIIPSAKDPGTPATVVAAIQKSIGESAEGWRMGFAHLGTKLGGASADLKAGIEKSLAGWGMAAGIVGEKAKKGVGGIGEWFGNVGTGIGSMKWLLYIVVIVLVFVAIMVSIGYSGLGGPAARIAEKEHARAR